MTSKTLFLAWQDKKPSSRQWFPIGRLDVSDKNRRYRFRYIRGAEKARKKAGFDPLVDFPDLYKNYESSELFPLFKNRIISENRQDFSTYLERLGLSEGAAPTEILSLEGGRATDSFEVFPKIERQQDGTFHCRFFLHGWSHVNTEAQKRLDSLKEGETLYVTLELTNPATKLAVQIQTEDYFMIGWAPRYLVESLVKTMAVGPHDFTAKVIKVNPVPAPSKQRLLVELSGGWPDHEPMTKGDFEPLAKSLRDSLSEIFCSER